LSWIDAAPGPLAGKLREYLAQPSQSLTDYLEKGLRLVAESLGFKSQIIRSSSFAIDPAIRGQERVVAIARAAGAARYLNAPGGRALYDAATFAAHGIELAFLSAYGGRYPDMLRALLHEAPEVIRQDIDEATQIEPANS